MSAQSIIHAFFGALQSIGSPAVEYLQSPLSPEEIATELTACPWIQAEWIDSWVLEWWSHHNGLTPEFERPASHRNAHEVSGMLFSLFSVSEAVEALEFRRGLILEQAPKDLVDQELARIAENPFVPLSVALGGGIQCLRKTGESNGRWQLWELSTFLDWEPCVRNDRSVLYFEDVLKGFVEAAANGEFAIGEWGDVISSNPAKSWSNAEFRDEPPPTPITASYTASFLSNSIVGSTSAAGGPVANTTIELYQSDGEERGDLVDTTVTDTDGQFSFGSLPSNCYAVRFIAPEGIALGGADFDRQLTVCRFMLRGINRDGSVAFNYGVGDELGYLRLVSLSITSLQRLEVVENGAVVHTTDLSPNAIAEYATDGEARVSNMFNQLGAQDALLNIYVNRPPVLGRDVDMNWGRNFPSELVSAVTYHDSSAYVLQHKYSSPSDPTATFERLLFRGDARVVPQRLEDGSIQADGSHLGLGAERVNYEVRDNTGRRLEVRSQVRDSHQVEYTILTSGAHYPLTGQVILISGEEPHQGAMPTAGRLNMELPLVPGSGEVLDAELRRVSDVAALVYFNFAVAGKVGTNVSRSAAASLAASLGSRSATAGTYASRVVILLFSVVSAYMVFRSSVDWSELEDKETD